MSIKAVAVDFRGELMEWIPSPDGIECARAIDMSDLEPTTSKRLDGMTAYANVFTIAPRC